MSNPIIKAALAGVFVTILSLPPVAGQARDLKIPPASYPKVAAHAASPEAFAPKGWRVEFTAQGDLKGDGAADVVLVLRDTDPGKIIDNDGFGPPRFDTNPRLLVVAFRNPAGGYDLALENHTLIPRGTEPNLDDILEDGAPPVIAGGALKVSLSLFANAGGWDAGQMSFAFRWRGGRWGLVGYDSSMVQRNSGETTDVSVNFLTRKIKRTTGRIDSDKDQVRWTKLPPGPLLSVDEVGDGMAFEGERLSR